jgi:hypothetical protein
MHQVLRRVKSAAANVAERDRAEPSAAAVQEAGEQLGSARQVGGQDPLVAGMRSVAHGAQTIQGGHTCGRGQFPSEAPPTRAAGRAKPSSVAIALARS